MATTQRKTRRTISTTQAAKELGVSAVTVRNWCQARKIGAYVTIPGTKCGYYLLSEAEVDWLKMPENRPKTGRPRKHSAETFEK